MNETRHKAIVIIGIVLLVIIGKMVHAELVYGDWTCAIAHCMKVSR